MRRAASTSRFTVLNHNGGVDKSISRASADLRTRIRPEGTIMRFLREENALGGEARAVLQSVKPVKSKQSEYQGYRAGPTDQSGSNHTMSILIGAAMIAAAILLSTLV